MANTYLNRTPSSSGSNTTWTYSCWYKKTSIGLDTVPWATGYTSPQIDESMINIGADDQLRFNIAINDATDVTVKSSRKLRDVSAWYHIVVACDTTQGTASNRIKFYINGELETNLSLTDYPTQGQSTFFGDTNKTQLIGRQPRSSNYLEGNMSHVAFVDGAALAPTVFGETDSTSGIWKWKDITGVTWGTNGFHLKFENSGNLGLDSSGNSNTFTVNGSATKNIDNPSISYATLNRLVNINSNLTLSNCNNTMTLGSTSWIGTLSSLGVNTGKWYWEIKVDTNNFMHGILGEKANMNELSTSNSGYIGKFSNGYAFYYQSPNARKQNNNSQSNYGTAPSSGDILMVAFDATNGTIWVGKNGTWFNNATQSEIESGTTTYSMYSSIPMTETFFPAACGENNHVANYNFGNGYFGTTAITSAGSNGNGSLFEYDVPSGYYALNTKNINTYG